MPPWLSAFFILQAHYRSTLDFSNEALQASEKGLARLLNAVTTLGKIQPSSAGSFDVDALAEQCKKAMEDDMNTAKLVGHLLGGIPQINKLAEGKDQIIEDDLDKLKALYHSWVSSVLGLELQETTGQANEISADLIDLILQLRDDAKSSRDFETADRIRNELGNLGITVKDRKDGADWEIS